MAIPLVVVAAVASVGLKILSASLQKTPKQDFNESLPDSSYRRSIPVTYNYCRLDVNWIEPFGVEEAFDTRTKGRKGGLFRKSTRRENLYGNFLGAVCASQTDLVTIWVNGEIKASELFSGKALEKGRDFLRKRVDWLDGSFDQVGRPEFGNLKFANRAYYEQLKTETGKEYNHNARVGYRGISCIGFKHLNLTEDIKSNTIPNVSILSKTKVEYTLGDIIIDVCKQAGIPSSRIDTTEVHDIACQGFRRLQNGEGFDQALGQLSLAYKFYATELRTGEISFRKFARPAGEELILRWQDFFLLEGGKLWDHSDSDEQELPKTINLSFIDPDFDFLENSVDSDEHPLAQNQEQNSIQLPVVLTKAQAKELANWHLNQIWIRRKSYYFELSDRYIEEVFIGRVLVLPDNTYVQVENYTVGAEYTMKINAVGYDSRSNFASSALIDGASLENFTADLSNSASYNQTEDDAASIFEEDGTLNYGQLRLLDIPASHYTHSELGVYCFSDRSGSILHLDRGNGYQEELTFADVSTFGVCETILADVNNINLESDVLPLIDFDNTVIVSLTSGNLANEITDLEFDQQQRIAFIGRYDGDKWIGEYICFQFADPLEGGLYQLQGLQRGLRGTEYYIDRHQAGEEFFLLVGENAYWERISIGISDIDLSFSGKLEIFEDQELENTPATTAKVIGQSLYPYPPVDLEVAEDPRGNLVFSFSDRSRGLERKTGEDNDVYELDLIKDDAVIRTINGGNSLVYSSRFVALDGLNLNSIDANIYKLSSVTGRGYVGLIRGLEVSEVPSEIIIAADGIGGFKPISGDYTLQTSDNGLWLLVDTDTDAEIILPELDNIQVTIQNVGTGQVKLQGNLIAASDTLETNESIDLSNLYDVWYGNVSKLPTSSNTVVDVVNTLPSAEDLSLIELPATKLPVIRTSTDLSLIELTATKLPVLGTSIDLHLFNQ